MAFAESFTTSQLIGHPSAIVFVDTSTGSDIDITERHIYLGKALGGFLVPSGTSTDYIIWPLADTTFQLDDILDKDRSLSVSVQWVSVSAVLYTSTQLTGFTDYSEQFDYDLSTMLAANPLLVNDNSFWENKSKLRLLINSGNNAIVYSSDIVSAQLCYDEATKLRLSSPYYFNESTN